MSPGASAGFAPCWMSLLQPSEVGLVIGPGTARTARPWSSAQSAVIRAPDPGAASITTVTPASPEIRRSEEHTSELQSRGHLVCRLLLEKKKRHSHADDVLIV